MADLRPRFIRLAHRVDVPHLATESLSRKEWIAVIGLALLAPVFTEISKALRRYLSRRS